MSYPLISAKGVRDVSPLAPNPQTHRSKAQHCLYIATYLLPSRSFTQGQKNSLKLITLPTLINWTGVDSEWAGPSGLKGQHGHNQPISAQALGCNTKSKYDRESSQCTPLHSKSGFFVCLFLVPAGYRRRWFAQPEGVPDESLNCSTQS